MLIIRKPSLNNVFVIKIMFSGFELISRLKVKFFKSKFRPFGVDEPTLRKYANLLNCGVL